MPSIKLPPSEAIDDLYRAILSLRSEDECHLFFGDLFTRQELSLFSQRLQVARMLSDGCTYGAVRSQLSTSSCTITRVNTNLQFGTGGYQLILERLNTAGTQTDEQDLRQYRTTNQCVSHCTDEARILKFVCA